MSIIVNMKDEKNEENNKRSRGRRRVTSEGGQIGTSKGQEVKSCEATLLHAQRLWSILLPCASLSNRLPISEIPDPLVCTLSDQRRKS